MVSFKEYTAHAFVGMRMHESLQGNVLQLLTTGGLIFGTPIEPRDGEYDTSRHLLPETVSGLVKSYHREHGKGNFDSAKYQFIELEDVTIINGSSRIRCSYLLVYVDQIVGVSLVDRDIIAP